jgi:hypothetical protein
MKKEITKIVLLSLLCGNAVYAQKSPDGRLSAEVVVESGSANLVVKQKGKAVGNPVKLGVLTSVENYSEALTLKSKSADKLVKDDYMMISGKRSHCVNAANERTYHLANGNGKGLDVVVRSYNNGIVFKYIVNQASADEKLTEEKTAYAIADGTRRWMQQYTSDYEQFFPLATDGKAHDVRGTVKGLWGYPALVEFGSNTFALITEADIRHGHCGSQLCNQTDNSLYQVRLAEALPIKSGFASPWRVMIIGSLADIVESTLVTDVSAPAAFTDTSWIKPAPASWIYWAYNHGSNDYQKAKEFIDLAAEMRWPYCLIDWEWDRMRNGGDIDDALRYAKSKNIRLFLWYNSSTNWVGEWGPNPMYRLNQPSVRNAEYSWLKEKGVDGIKIDFFKDDSRAMMDYYLDILEDAAKQQMMITFHGATLPRGWQRTYPNLMTTEAVRGAEWYNNTAELTNRAACHNATLPFTRNVVGSMDYTPGTFSDSQHKHITTHGHELALYFLFESAVQHCPDRPDVYRSLPVQVRQLLSSMPTAWDDTKLLAGYPGEDVVIARRKGDCWYIAGINGTDKARSISFSLKRLGIKGKSMTIFADGSDDHSFSISERQQLRGDIKMSVRPRGGFVIKLK